MANVLTNLAADIYTAADRVGRELVGFIPSVTVNAGSERVAKDGTVRSAFTRAQTVNTSFSPAMTIPEGTDQTVDNKTMTIDSFASIQIPYTGEDIKALNNGAGYETVYGDQIQQAFRSISNKIEQSIWLAGYKASSRAYGTAGTTPFASNFNELAQLRRILEDNSLPFDNQISVVMSTAAAANLRSLAQLQKANEGGGQELLRQGTMLDLLGFMLKSSGQIGTHTKGTGTSYQTNSASLVAGNTAIAADTGSGTILAGDIITFAADSNNKFAVNSALSGGSFSIGTPGLRSAIADDNAITVGNNYTPNLAFHRSAIEIAVRPPATPPMEAAMDKMIVQDPWSGLSFEIAAYGGYMKGMIEVRCLYGVKVWKPDFVATLIG